MYLIWRGWGWLVPVIVIAAFVATQLGLNAAIGENTYESAEWPKYMAAGVAAALIGLAGYLLNYKYRKVAVNEETGEKHKAPSHHFFFVPMEFWAVVVPVAFIWFTHQATVDEQRMREFVGAPQANDIYLVDFTEFFEDADAEYKYGAMKVVGIHDIDIEVLPSMNGYNKRRGPRDDLRDGKMQEEGYFVSEPLLLPKDMLEEMVARKGIYDVAR